MSDIIARTVTLIRTGAVYRFHEEDGTALPLNAKGYTTQSGAYNALCRFYAVGIPQTHDNGSVSVPLTGMSHPNREIAPRDEAFVGRMIDHDLAQEAKAHDVSRPTGKPEFFRLIGRANVFRLTRRYMAADVIPSVHGVCDEGITSARVVDVEFCNADGSPLAPASAVAAQPVQQAQAGASTFVPLADAVAPIVTRLSMAMPVQQAQSHDGRAASPILQRLAEANAVLDGLLRKFNNDNKLRMKNELDYAFDDCEKLRDMAVAADPVAYVRAYPRHAMAYRHLLPADMVARIEAAETDAEMLEAVRDPAQNLNDGRKHSTNPDGTPRNGWFDARCVSAKSAPYLTEGRVYRLREVRNGWFETEDGDRMAQFRFERI